jgi:1,4-alpha-glucan branching enzyme
MLKGYLNIILHAHLPFVRHPESEEYIEERWLFEAISETYIPLLIYFKKLESEKIKFRITMSITPPLISMLTDDLLQKRYLRYLLERIWLAKKEITRTKDNPELNKLSKMYYYKFKQFYKVYKHEYKCNLITGFKYFQDIGSLEIICSAATHGFLPLINITPNAVRAQISVGVDIYKFYFGRKPNGMWLPECAYTPELDNALKEFGIKYIIVESHGITYADPKPLYGTLAPIISPKGIVAFGRDMESSKQVWSSICGYPGDPNYREFYKDIGYELDWDYIKPYVAKCGHRIDTGIKYNKITGKTENKELYNEDKALAVCEMQADHFISSRIDQINKARNKMINPPIVTCPYDAELFGHWWFEGPYWLYILFKKIHYNQDTFELITPSEYMTKYPNIQESSPSISTWGAHGYNEVWLNTKNDYIYRHLHSAGERMVVLANNFRKPTDLQRKALNQCTRELLLAQSSDWPFIITTGTMVDYAHKRIKDHIGRFNTLADQLDKNEIDEKYIAYIYSLDNIFPNIDYSIYSI